MKDAHTDFVIVTGGITAPIWVNALTDWFALFATMAACVVGCFRVYQLFWSKKHNDPK